MKKLLSLILLLVNLFFVNSVLAQALVGTSTLNQNISLRGNKGALISSPAQIYIPAGIILFILLFVFLVKMKKRQNFVTIISITIPVFLVLLWLIYIFSVYAVNNMFAVL
jgi:hypothetical protein